MRGAVILGLLALVLVGAVNHTSYNASSSFSLDGQTWDIIQTYENYTYVRTQGTGRIHREGECVDTTYWRWCINESTNVSATISTYSKRYNISLERYMDEEVALGEEYDVLLIILSDAEKPITLSLHEENPHPITDTRGFDDDLTWEGTLDPGQERRLHYTAKPQRSGEANLSATVSGDYNATSEAEILVTDDLTVEAEYQGNATHGATYNFTLTVDGPAGPELTVRIHVPKHLRVTDTDNVYERDGALYKRLTLNGTHEYTFSYRTLRDSTSPVRVEVDTDDDGVKATREYLYRIRENPFGQLLVLHDHDNKSFVAGRDHPFPIQIHNPNNRSIPATFTLESYLLETSESLTIPANTTLTRNYTIRPNTSRSVYNIALTLSYEDPNGEPVLHEEAIRVRGAEEPPPPPAPPASPAATITIAEALRSNETAELVVTANHTPTGTLTVERDGELLAHRILTGDAEVRMNVTGPGTYVATIRAGNDTIVETRIVEDPDAAPDTPVAVEPEERAISWAVVAVPLIIILLGAGAALVYGRRHQLLTEQLLSQEQAAREDERMLGLTRDPEVVAALRADLAKRRERIETLQSWLRKL